MWRRLLVGGLLCLLPVSAQSLTVRQLVKMVRSSIELKHKDKEVAKYLKRVHLTERLTPSAVEDLQGLGAGPHTLAALNELRIASEKLPTAQQVIEKRKPVMPPPSQQEQDRIINWLREYALNYTKQLPDFICTRVTRRYADPSGMEFWHKMDTVTAKLTYFDQKEDYTVVLINNRPVNTSLDDVGGSTSTGEFGTMMKEIFEPATDTVFQWERWGKLRGRLCYVFNYFVRQENSKWSISYEKRMRTVPAYRGLIYVDKDTEIVMRITLHSVNIEPSFPVQEASTVLDYDLVKISGHEFMLPLKSAMRMRQGKLLVKNEDEFRLYRKFGTESTISFKTPDELPADMFKETPPTQ